MQPFNDPSFPLLEVTAKGILSKSGEFTVGYELIRPPLFSLPGIELEAIHGSWVKAIRALPHGTILCIQDHYYKREWQPDKAGDECFKGSYMANHCHVFITRRATDRKHTRWDSSTLLRRSLTPAFVQQPQELKTFLEACRQFAAILRDGGKVKLQHLTREELVGKAGNMGILEQYCLQTGPDDIVLSDISFGEDVNIQGRPCPIYSLADAERLPADCRPSIRYEPYSTAATDFPVGFATGLGPLLPVDHLYNVFIFLDDPQKTLAEMETRRRRLKSLSGQSRENAVASEDIGQFLQEAAASQRRPVKMHCHLMALNRDGENASELRRSISAAITRFGAVPYRETVGTAQLWWATIPGNAGEFPMEDTFDTFVEQAACFIVPETYDKGSEGSFGIRLGERLTGCPLQIDFSDEPREKGYISNRNKFVLGGSGSGKSVFINHCTSHYILSGAHVLIVDIGGSYKGLCALLGGLYLAYSEQQPICFNPFRLEAGEQPDTEKKESLKTLLLSLWKKSNEEFRRSEYVALSNALQGYYQFLGANEEIIACFDSFYEYARDIYSAVLLDDKVKTGDFDMDNFLYVLRPFYKGGEYGYLLNAMDQPSLLQERLIIFELDNIRDHPILFPVVTIIIMEVFISKMRRLQGIRKVIIIEEAWKAIAKEGMSEYIKYLFKTVRKFFGEAIVVTQDIEDIISSPVVKNAIINNADCKILLDQSKFLHRFGEIQKLLGLTDHDKALALSLNKANDPKRKYKEVFIGYANGPSQVYRTEISLEEYLAYTTEESEKIRVNQYAVEHGGLREGIAALANVIRSGAVRFILVLALCGLTTLMPTNRASAQVLEVVEIVDAVIKKVIMAADLQVQRVQTQTIALQNAEKELENNMAGDLLDDITGWVQQEENLYGEYYQELWTVKSALSTYSKTATLIERQVQLVKEEQQDWAAVQKDPHFSAAELSHIGAVYTGILNESTRNIQQIQQVITAFITQMDDANRLRIVDQANKGIDDNYLDLRGFTQQNSLLSLQRAKDEDDVLTIKSLYNLP